MIEAISDINPEFEDYEFSYEESYSWGKSATRKYSQRVIAYKITEENCYILLKGELKFFAFKYFLKNQRVHRIKDKSFILGEDKIVICHQEAYDYFKKMLLVGSLKELK